jgi:hypothetical protein
MRTSPTVTKNGTWNLTGCTGPNNSSFISPNGFTMEVTMTGAGIFYAYPDSTDDTFTCSAEL